MKTRFIVNTAHVSISCASIGGLIMVRLLIHLSAILQLMQNLSSVCVIACTEKGVLAAEMALCGAAWRLWRAVRMNERCAISRMCSYMTPRAANRRGGGVV